MTNQKPLSIAIDGPAASGKSTVAERIAEKLSYLFFDTGVMYRAVTWGALQVFGNVDDEEKVSVLAEKVKIDVVPPSLNDGRKCDIHLDGVDITWEIRTPNVDRFVSKVSAYPRVRQAMTMQQRRIGEQGNIVMVGRDIGTVVLPQADIKIFLDASIEERARRRYEELVDRGEPASLEAVLYSMQRRDEIDSTREVAPLKPAEDAIRVNSDGKTVDEVVQIIIDLVKRNH